MKKGDSWPSIAMEQMEQITYPITLLHCRNYENTEN